MTRKMIGWAAAALLFASGMALAQDNGAPRGKGRGRGGEGAPGGPFRQLDTDRDGKVSKAEFEAGFAKLDKDGDGFITKEELGSARQGRRGAGKKGQGPQEKKNNPADLVFSKLDTDGDGKVSKAEFEAAFAKLDRDGDGFIDQKSGREGRGEGKAGRGKAGRGRGKGKR